MLEAEAADEVTEPLVPRLIVEIRFGTRDGEKTILEPGRTVRVGRSEVTDLVLPRDSLLSAVHFSITWDGAVATVSDHASVQGTFVNGERVTHARVASGSWLRAGDTTFSVHVEGATEPRSGVSPVGWDEDAHTRRRLRQRARDALFETANLYAVLDASKDERVLELLRESVEETRSLFEGTEGQALAEVGPYLVRLPRRSRLTEALAMEAWGLGWGIYLIARMPFKEVRTHLRRFLLVEREKTAERLYFRYYDPEVLRVFLPTASTRQRAELFGPIEAFAVEAEDGSILRFSPGSAPAQVWE